MGEDQAGFDAGLLERFDQEIWSKIPHIEDGVDSVVNLTPLVDLTEDLSVQERSTRWTCKAPT